MTQAGGRLPPETARTYAEWARGTGVRFFVMYGQTEATARMAYVPPELLLDNPGCIGMAIPGAPFISSTRPAGSWKVRRFGASWCTAAPT